LNAAIELHQSGKLVEAEAAYRRILSRNPRDPDALHLLGTLAGQGRRPDIAVDLIGKALALRPDEPDYLGNYGEFLRLVGRAAEAIAALRRSIAIRPGSPFVHNNLGVALATSGRTDEAIREFRQAVSLAPQYADALSNLGISLREKGDLDGAIGYLSRAIELAPANFSAQSNLGTALVDAGRFDEAMSALNRAVDLQNDYAKARWNRGLLKLMLGDFQRGWEEFEWRLKCREIMGDRNFPQPRWTSGSPAGKRLLVCLEQGYGDVFQFLRFIPRIQALGAHPIIECPPELLQLLGPNLPGCEIAIEGKPLPSFDIHVSILSVAGILSSRLDTIPTDIPYMRADANLSRKIAAEMGPRGLGPRVGIAWAGRPTHPNERNRSMKLAQFGPLAAIPNIEFFSLQKGEAAAQAASPPTGMHLRDLTAQLPEFADTAALIDNLNLVISVDTAVAHLAAAMGKPVWILLPYVPDWRWMLKRTDSPWYPTVRLFRQPQRGDWAQPLREITRALATFAADFQTGTK
jgi:Flp pilus assembly protein TadD